jgi:NitT/TauT family transport system substrate-binding protein
MRLGLIGRVLVVGMSVTLTLTACDDAADPGKKGSSETLSSKTLSSATLERTTVKVGAQVASASAPLFIAMRRGFFREEGLTVEYSPIGSGPAALPAMLRREMDFSLLDYTTAFSAADKAPGQLKFVADGFVSAPGTYDIMVRGASKIETVRDLNGKTIAIPAGHAMGELAVTAALKAGGVDPRAGGVKFISAPFPQMPRLLADKKVDAIWAAEPFASVAREEQGARELADTMSGPLANLAAVGWAATATFVKENPNTTAAFVRAITKATRLAASDPDLVKKTLPTYMAVDPDRLSTISMGTYPTALDATRLQHVSDVMRKFGLLSAPGDAKSLIAAP